MKEEINKGIKYMLFASFLFALMGAAAKELSSSMSSVEVSFFRNIFGVFIILFALYKKPPKQTGGKPWLLFFRGFAGFVSLLMFFYMISVVPLGEAMTFSKTSTIFTAVLAYIFLKEKLGFKGWIGVFIGFMGIVCITKFDGIHLDKNAIIGIFCGFGAALAYTSVRELRKYYDSRVIVLSFMAIGTIGPAILLLIGNYYTNPNLDFMIATFTMPKNSDWIYIVLLGIFATQAQLYMTKAYGFAKAGIIGTISYSNIVFSIAIGLMMGDSFPEIIVILGIICIVISGLLVSSKKE